MTLSNAHVFVLQLVSLYTATGQTLLFSDVLPVGDALANHLLPQGKFGGSSSAAAASSPTSDLQVLSVDAIDPQLKERREAEGINADPEQSSGGRGAALSVVLWSLARLRIVPPDWWLDEAFRMLLSLAKATPAHSLGIGSLSSEAAEAKAARGGRVGAPALGPHDAAMAIWALGKCGARPGGPALQALLNLTGLSRASRQGGDEGGGTGNLSQLSCSELSALLGGLVQMAFVPRKSTLQVRAIGGG